ncbi:marine proteobacterial sortase target protein [Gammaproteobacteria bacterium 42_54_T18]|nr:marine proteobacterial sortase target protein [Gammaproteobacteria bacterium 42_54_T18]
MVVQAVVTQVFVNDSDQWIEGKYVFPLPSGSAVNGMTIRIGERIIKGQIKEKNTARKMFIKARQEGKKASLIEQQRPNLFTNRVTNIAPGERIEVVLAYLQTLRYIAGEFSLRIPMTITPRYIPGNNVVERPSLIAGQGWAFNTDQVPDASDITPSQRSVAELEIFNRRAGLDAVGMESAKLTNVATVNIVLTPGFDVALLESSFHAISFKKNSFEKKSGASSEQYIVTTKKPNVAMNRDFVLRWRPVATQAPVAAFFNESLENEAGKDEYHGLLMVMPPQQINKQQLPARDLVLVIDTSGSMAGTSMEQAKQALLLALERLTATDYFNVIEFNSNTHKLFDQSVVASDNNIAVARRYVNGLDANGGTEMKGALEAALVSSVDDESTYSRVRQVVFITDGSVGNEEALFAYIVKNVQKNRLFTVAIGSAPNGYFMKKAAQFGRGVYVSIGSVQEVNSAMSALFEKIERPVLTDVNVIFHNGGETEFYPVRIPDLYAQEPLLLYVKLAEPSDTVTISGEYEGQYWQQNVVPNWSVESTGQSISEVKGYRGVATLWARQKIEHLMDEAVRQGNRDQFRDDIVALGVHYNIMSRYTSFVAIDQAPSRSKGKNLKRRAIANSMPAGSKQGVPSQPSPSIAYPRTALGINGLILSGVLSLFLALIVLCLKQDRYVLSVRYARGRGSRTTRVARVICGGLTL